MSKNKEVVRIIKFALISGSAGIIELGVFALMNEFLSLPYWPCYLAALISSILWNFTINRSYTFKSAANVPRAMALVFLFYVFFTPTSTIIGNYLAETLLWNEYAVTALNMGFNLTLEYLWDRYIVYGKNVDTNTHALKQKKADNSFER